MDGNWLVMVLACWPLECFWRSVMTTWRAKTSLHMPLAVMAFSSTLTCWQKLLFAVMLRTANVDPRLVLMCWHLTRVVVLALDLCRYVEPRLVSMCCLSTCVDVLTLDSCQWVDPRLVSTCWLLTRVDVLRLNLCRCVDGRLYAFYSAIIAHNRMRVERRTIHKEQLECIIITNF